MNPTEILDMCRDERPDVAAAGRLLAARMRLPRKVLVTDLDGTLWKGVSGEGGVLKANGEALMALWGVRHRGGLVAIATWNDPAVIKDALSAVGRSVRMLLSTVDFAAIECGYDPKPAMLRRIANTLNLSVDSFVFVDDDPMQRARVAQELPGVIVLTPEDDPVPYFEPVTVTDEDRRRAQMYEEEKERERAREGESDPRAFLRSLGLKIRIERCRPEQRARVVQLLERTTQFNLTGTLWTEQQLVEVERDGGMVLVASASDRYGEYGLVAAAIVERSPAWCVLNLVVSCRILGRGVDTAMMRSIKQRIGCRPDFKFTRTDRNRPAEVFIAAWACRKESPCDHAEIEDIP